MVDIARARALAEKYMVPGVFTLQVATTTKVGGEQSTGYADGATIKGRLIGPQQTARELMIGAAVGTATPSSARLPHGTAINRADRIRHNPSGVVFEVTDIATRDYDYDRLVILTEVT